MMAGAVEGDVFVGSKAAELRGLLQLRWPVKHGIVEDWLDMEHIWQHIYQEMKVRIAPELARRSAHFPDVERIPR